MIRRIDDGVELVQLRWGFPPSRPKAAPVINLWRPMSDGTGDAFTILTTEPGPDVAAIHDRQVVVLDRADWLAWLDLSRPEAELLRPLPAGSLVIAQVR